MKIFLFGILALFVIWNLSFGIFNVAQAQEGLVPCGPGIAGNETCDFCDLLKLGKGIIDLTIKIAVLIIVAMIVYGGFLIMFSAGSTEKVKTGRSVIQSAIIGLIIAISAWLIVDVTFRVLVNTQTPEGLKAPWYKIGSNLNC